MDRLSLRLPLLDRYLFWELLAPFLWGIGIFLTLLLGIDLLPDLAKLSARGADLLSLFRLFLLDLPSLLALTFPMAMLLASVLGIGRLSGDGEMVAFFASGISLYRILLPVMVLGILVSLLTFQWNERVVPPTAREAGQLKRKLSQPQEKQVRVVQPQYEGGRLTQLILAEQFDPVTGKMVKVNFFRFKEGLAQTIITAQEAIYSGHLEWTFRRGTWIQETPRGFYTVNFTEQKLWLGRTPSQISSERIKGEYLNARELRQMIEAQRQQGIDTSELEVALQHKYAIPAGGMVFALLGVPLGFRPHRGNRSLGMGLSVIILLVYYILFNFLSGLAGRGALSPPIAVWLPNGLAIITAGGLIVKTPK